MHVDHNLLAVFAWILKCCLVKMQTKTLSPIHTRHHTHAALFKVKLKKENRAFGGR